MANEMQTAVAQYEKRFKHPIPPVAFQLLDSVTRLAKIKKALRDNKPVPEWKGNKQEWDVL